MSKAHTRFGRRARGTPRIANRLLRRVRDFAQVIANGVITLEVARTALAQLEIDELGLDESDRRLLRAIIELFNGGPVGLSTLAAALAEEIDAVEDVYEPFLLQLGFLLARRVAASLLAAPTSTLAFPTPSVAPPPTTPTRHNRRGCGNDTLLTYSLEGI